MAFIYSKFSLFISLPSLLHADTNHVLITYPPDRLKWSRIFMMLLFYAFILFTFRNAFRIAFIAPPLSS